MLSAALLACAAQHANPPLAPCRRSGSDGAVLQRMQAAMRAFFDLPMDTKQQVGRGPLRSTQDCRVSTSQLAVGSNGM